MLCQTAETAVVPANSFETSRQDLPGEKERLPWN